MPQKISIDRAKPGMKVVKDVVNEAGMVVLPAGKELTESLINRLSSMDIDYIYVEGEKQLPPKDKVFEDIEKKFKRADDSYTLLIKKAIQNHFEELYK
ncbi:hypothetical protein [Thermodesulfovibrio hydrogeniphilus]